jgi:hypothetical protein
MIRYFQVKRTLPEVKTMDRNTKYRLKWIVPAFFLGLAIAVLSDLGYSGYAMLLGLVGISVLISRHASRCSHCWSWNTYSVTTLFDAKSEAGIRYGEKVRHCRACKCGEVTERFARAC